ncbi:unnamed protein product, partial [Onchocerca flexuosa]|uniref:Ovule protein n=1 Tax=Onchocerca flexuosa TaxID=387005 RepID=A0A183I703_9BILA
MSERSLAIRKIPIRWTDRWVHNYQDFSPILGPSVHCLISLGVKGQSRWDNFHALGKVTSIISEVIKDIQYQMRTLLRS